MIGHAHVLGYSVHEYIKNYILAAVTVRICQIWRMRQIGHFH